MKTPHQHHPSDAAMRFAELRDDWLSRPANYKPPPWAPTDAHAEHHARWLASAEYAHGQQLLRAAQPAHPPTHPTS